MTESRSIRNIVRGIKVIQYHKGYIAEDERMEVPTLEEHVNGRFNRRINRINRINPPRMFAQTTAFRLFRSTTHVSKHVGYSRFIRLPSKMTPILQE